MEKNEQKRARRLLEMLRQAANSLFRRFPLRNPVWVGFGSNGKVTEFSIGKSSENAENPDEIERFQPDLVGVSGFEPEASWSRTKRDTKLRHTPISLSIILVLWGNVKWENGKK